MNRVIEMYYDDAADLGLLRDKTVAAVLVGGLVAG